MNETNSLCTHRYQHKITNETHFSFPFVCCFFFLRIFWPCFFVFFVWVYVCQCVLFWIGDALKMHDQLCFIYWMVDSVGMSFLSSAILFTLEQRSSTELVGQVHPRRSSATIQLCVPLFCLVATNAAQVPFFSDPIRRWFPECRCMKGRWTERPLTLLYGTLVRDSPSDRSNSHQLLF